MMDEAEIDAVLDEVDKLMWSGKFGELNRTIARVAIDEHRVGALVCWLTATLPAKTRLPVRERLIDRARQLGANEAMLRGL